MKCQGDGVDICCNQYICTLYPLCTHIIHHHVQLLRLVSTVDVTCGVCPTIFNDHVPREFLFSSKPPKPGNLFLSSVGEMTVRPSFQKPWMHFMSPSVVWKAHPGFSSDVNMLCGQQSASSVFPKWCELQQTRFMAVGELSNLIYKDICYILTILNEDFRGVCLILSLSKNTF